MAKTLRDRYEEGLVKLGYTRQPSDSRKYWVFTKDNYQKVFLGKSGAVRRGRNITSSIPLSDLGKKRLLGEA